MALGRDQHADGRLHPLGELHVGGGDLHRQQPFAAGDGAVELTKLEIDLG
jgi:hypothetical protein